MDPVTVGIVGLVILLVLLAIRLPVGYAMASVGLVGFIYMVSAKVGLTMAAAKHAYRGPGVSVLSTPTDILVEKSDADRLDPECRLHVGEAWPAEGEVEAAAELIDSCERVAILAGWGARHHGEEISRLSEKLKAPVATTSRGKGTIDETGRRSVGVLGSIGGWP